MIIFDDTPKEWDSKNAEDLKAFLTSDLGRLALAWVGTSAPKYADGSDPNKTLVAAGRVEGFQEAIKCLFSLTHEQPPEVKQTEEYPSLDDDSQWSNNLAAQPTQPN
jgi:hypothetical protein